MIDSGGSYWLDRPVAKTSNFGLTTDRLLGRGGNDRLIGGKGFVEMTGGTGADTFEARCDIFRSNSSDTGARTDRHSGPEGDDHRLRPWAGRSNRAEHHLDAAVRRSSAGPGARGQRRPASARATDIDVDEVGYSTVERSDGSIDTIITYRFLATSTDRRAAPRESATSASCSRTTTAGSPTTG